MRHHFSIINLGTFFIILFNGFMFPGIINVLASENAYNPAIVLVDRLNKNQPKTKWEALVDFEAADFISFIGNDRVLVGSVQSGSKLGVPKYGNIMLYNSHSGKRVWSAGRTNIRKDEYTLLTTKPVILLMYKNSKTTIFQAYDPVKGQKKWHLELASPIQFVLSGSLKKMYCLAPNKPRQKADSYRLWIWPKEM
ncbi:MAG: hypothetical protein KAH62_00320 [Desulfobacula sp.]|nr:hypothetical protein [Desulfobacula sp.]